MILRKITAFVMVLILALSALPCAQAAKKKAKATATPEPEVISARIEEPPEQISNMLDIAYTEWEETAGKKLAKSNKYTKWWNNYKWEWCAGFVTWCMLEAGIPQDFKDDVKKLPEGSVRGIYHVKASSPGKMLEGYLHLHRTTMMPQKGYVVMYGEASNRYIHVGIIYDVQPLEDGKYRITTVEGNMANTVRMYVYDYDMNAEKQKNITAVPTEERDREEAKNFTYKIRTKSGNSKVKWYVNCFLMPWVPGEDEASSVDGADPDALSVSGLTGLTGKNSLPARSGE